MKYICGIVLYNPELKRLRLNINNICRQVDKIVFVDNGSENLSEIKELILQYKNVELISNDINQGVACALNQIFDYAMGEGYEWVLTLDQDSWADSSLIAKYNFVLEKDSLNIGILSPNIIDINVNKNLVELYLSEGGQEIDKCITSGSLTRIECWNQVGRFDELLFIDEVDFDFCERIAKTNYKILKVNNTYINHEIGNASIVKILWLEIKVLNHNAFRKYYIARNIMIMSYKYYSIKRYILAHLKVLKQFLLVLFFEKKKCAKLHSILRGYSDGKKLGKKYIK